MTTATGHRLACCGRVLNNSSWNFVADGCVVARNATMEAQYSLALHTGRHRVPLAGPVIQQARLSEHPPID
ncbi:MAG: hypothetical protein ACE5Q3_15880 [Alphaproteobacteria bacterium]